MKASTAAELSGDGAFAELLVFAVATAVA